MRVLLILVMLCAVLDMAFGQKKSISMDKSEAKKAFVLLNDIRMNPKKYAKELGISNPEDVKNTRLVWNEQLAKAAEFRAYDMANRDYFDHVTPEGIGPNYYIDKAGYHLNPDWLKRLSANNFESIAANHTKAEEGIRAFVIGRNSPGLMHRKHVLGMDEWNGSLVDIGIGFARVPKGSTYKTYLCVIIAKHDWQDVK